MAKICVLSKTSRDWHYGDKPDIVKIIGYTTDQTVISAWYQSSKRGEHHSVEWIDVATLETLRKENP